MAIEHRHVNGCRVDLRAEDVEACQLHMLSSVAKFKKQGVIIPKEHPMALLDLRLIFSLLRKRTIFADEDNEKFLPLECFQRAFERMFFIMQDPVPFDAKAYDENGDGFVSWGEFVRVYKQRSIKVKMSIFERLYLTFDNPDSSGAAWVLSLFVLLTIMVSSLVFILSTTPECHISPDSCKHYEYVEKSCLLIFVVEFTVRMCTCWSCRSELHDKAKFQEMVVGFDPIRLPSPLQRFARFALSIPNIIDLAAILPGVVGLFVQADGGAFVVLRLIRLTRIFRAFKSPALVAPVVVIGRTLEKSTKALYVLAFNLCLGIVIFGSLMYMVEGGDDLSSFNVGGRWNATLQKYVRQTGREWNQTGQEWTIIWDESPFQSIPAAFWWAIVTATTVGYGDTSPTTTLGCVVAMATMVFSMVVLALPVGVMGGTFSQEWERFQREKAEKVAFEAEEMVYITQAMTRLDPTRLSRLLLLEVWNEHPRIPREEKSRPPASTFMGEAQLELDLPPDRPVFKEMRLTLCDNPRIVKRRVTGSILVKYDWRPTSPDKPAVSKDPAASPLQGTLEVSVLEGRNLINLHCAGGTSNPYVTIMCFPSYSDFTGPQAFFWRMPTLRNKLNPLFHMSCSVDFDWASEENLDNQSGGLPEGTSRRDGDDPAASDATAATPRVDEAIAAVQALAREFAASRDEMRQVTALLGPLDDVVGKFKGQQILEHDELPGMTMS